MGELRFVHDFLRCANASHTCCRCSATPHASRARRATAGIQPRDDNPWATTPPRKANAGTSSVRGASPRATESGRDTEIGSEPIGATLSAGGTTAGIIGERTTLLSWRTTGTSLQCRTSVRRTASVVPRAEAWPRCCASSVVAKRTANRITTALTSAARARPVLTCSRIAACCPAAHRVSRRAYALAV